MTAVILLCSTMYAAVCHRMNDAESAFGQGAFPGFIRLIHVVIRRRRVVERTFAWIMKRRRLVRDYEQLPRAAATLLRRWQ